MEGYDEDLNENQFFIVLKTKYKHLFDLAAENRNLICIPRTNSFSRQSLSESDFKNHVLKLKEDTQHIFQTLDNKEVQIAGNVITTTSGFNQVRSVNILFEETYYNSAELGFRVLCVDQMLEGGRDLVEQPMLINLDNIDDCKEFLWGNKVSRRSQKQVDDMIDAFNSAFHTWEGESLRHNIDAANTLFTKALQTVFKESHIKKASRQNRTYVDNLKVAMETYLMHNIFKKVFKAISALVASQDAKLNKITRNLSELQLRDMGIQPQFKQNIPHARRALSTLNSFTTPLEKLYCLRRMVMSITSPPIRRKDTEPIEPVTSDDLIPVLVFLVIKVDIPNWLANLSYMQNFRFSKPSNDEFGFYLASVEAAVEHVRSGHMETVPLSAGGFRVANITRSSVDMPWLRLDSMDGQHTPSIDILFEYIRDGQDIKVEEMLNQGFSDQDQLNDLLCHPLCSCDKCEKLIYNKCNDASSVTVFSRDDRGCTALHMAAMYGRPNLMDLMVAKNAVVDVTNYHGYTPLHLSCQKGHQNTSLLLLDYGANPNIQDNDDNTPLHLCCANGHDDCVAALLYFEQTNAIKLIDVNIANCHGDTPLHLASRWGYEVILLSLLEHGASVEARNRKQETPLMCAHNIKVSNLLLKAAKEMEENQGNTYNHPSSPPTASTLQAEKTQPRLEAVNGMSLPVQFNTKSTEIDRLLTSVADGDIQMVRFHLGWLTSDLDLDSEDEEEDDSKVMVSVDQKLCHPLCQCSKCAVLQRRTSLASDSQVNVNSTNQDGFSPLHFAAMHGRQQILALLLRRGASLNSRTKTQQCTPLHLACHHNHPNLVVLLLQHGAKCNIKDSRGNSPLHYCAIAGNTRPVSTLIKYGANVNQVNNRGNTPLHEAARWNHISLVKLLLQRGAIASPRNKAQLTPLQFAQNDMVVRLLEDAEDGFYDSNEETSVNNSIKKQFPVTASPVKQVKLKDLFAAFEEKDMRLLRELGYSIKTFNRAKSLKKATTIDKSGPKLDKLLVHQLSIQKFDQRKLHHINSNSQREKSILNNCELGTESVDPSAAKITSTPQAMPANVPIQHTEAVLGATAREEFPSDGTCYSEADAKGSFMDFHQEPGVSRPENGGENETFVNISASDLEDNIPFKAEQEMKSMNTEYINRDGKEIH